MSGKIIVGLCVSIITAAIAHAQTPPASRALASEEDIEPRIIGTTGTMMVGFGGFMDRSLSVERLLPINLLVQVDVSRFVTRRVVVAGGLAGMGSFGGEDSDALAVGTGAPALHAFGGGLFYFTPQSIASFYSGGEYWAQLTQRGDREPGSVIGKLGLQGAVSSRAMFFIEAGYGFALARGERDELVSRILGRVGIRLKF